MPDPVSYLSTKIASAIGGFLGGAAIMTFIKPKTIPEAFIRGAISTGSAIIFADPVLQSLALREDWNFQLAAGALVGFIAYSVLGAVANFFKQNQKDDIVTLVKKAKGNKE
jgi:hypothetical protein